MPRRSSKPPNLADLLGFDPMQIRNLASMFMQGVETVAPGHKRLMEQMGQFAAHLSRSAVTNWATNLPGQPCCMQDCGGEAVLLCMACGQPVCLAHVHVSHRAEGVCDECVRSIMESKGRQYQQPGSRQPDAKEVRRAQRVLGLSNSATWVEVQRAHRILAAEHHPDRQRNPAARKRAEEKSKEINAAFDLLKRHYDRKAAA